MPKANNAKGGYLRGFQKALVKGMVMQKVTLWRERGRHTRAAAGRQRDLSCLPTVEESQDKEMLGYVPMAHPSKRSD